MKDLKQVVIDELLEKINESPFLLVADYGGMTVPEFAELRNRLREADSKFHVAKNTFVKRAADAAGYPEGLGEFLTGQSAIITGDNDVCAAVKVMENFFKEFNRPPLRGGVLDGTLLDAKQVAALADLPPIEVLRAQLLGVMSQPGTRLATVFSRPGTEFVTVLSESLASLVRVLQAKKEKG